MKYRIVELTDRDRAAVKAHLLRLSTEDRRLRFFTTLSDEAVKRYVDERLDFNRGRIFGVLNPEGRLVGVAQASEVVEKDGHISCEAAFSIDREERSHGLARRLMQAIITHCRERGVSRLCMSCLRNNERMKALALSFGLKMRIDFDEVYAELGVTDVTGPAAELNTSPKSVL